MKKKNNLLVLLIFLSILGGVFGRFLLNTKYEIVLWIVISIVVIIGIYSAYKIAMKEKK
tara:strand:+ start:5597 stop:5773 length:177 start_codon:yes stop_codon:yes gene_type:complete